MVFGFSILTHMMIPLGSVIVTEHIKIAFIFIAVWYSVSGMYKTSCIYSSIEGTKFFPLNFQFGDMREFISKSN